MTSPSQCKLCGSKQIGPRYRVDRPGDHFKILACDSCDMHFIDYLDPELASDSNAEAPKSLTRVETEKFVKEGLESNSERTELNAELLSKHVTRGDVLDVGSGGGGFLARIKDDQRRVVGLELDPKYVSYSQAAGLVIIAHPLEHPVWDSHAGKFDAVTLWDVIEHVNDPLLVCKRIKMLLRQDGVLLIDTPNRDGILYRFGQFTARLSGGRRLTTLAAQYSAAPFCHKQIFSKRHMRRMLLAAGFTDIRIVTRTELSFPVEFYLKTLVPRPRLRKIINPIASTIAGLMPLKNKLIVVAQ